MTTGEVLRPVVAGFVGGVLWGILWIYLQRLGVWILTRWRLRGFVSVRDGEWNDPDTWNRREVPGDGARVVLRHRVLAPRAGLGTGRVTQGLSVFAEGDGGLD